MHGGDAIDLDVPDADLAPQALGDHVDHHLVRLDASAAYATELGLQFGAEAAMRAQLGAAPGRFTVRAAGTASPRSGPTSRRTSPGAG